MSKIRVLNKITYTTRNDLGFRQEQKYTLIRSRKLTRTGVERILKSGIEGSFPSDLVVVRIDSFIIGD